ncbi:MAG TPA: LysR family transcriptional regulator, partial [Pantoea agglomerans]|nr:LysR family transcriptional regulator [Pantoea agglomerans]
GWLLLIIFTTLALTGPGGWRIGAVKHQGVRHGAG